MATANRRRQDEQPEESGEQAVEGKSELEGKSAPEIAALLRRSLTRYKRLIEQSDQAKAEEIRAIVEERRDALNAVVDIEDETYEPLFVEVSEALKRREQRDRPFPQIDRRVAKRKSGFRGGV